MTQLVLIRPGSTDYDEQGRIQGVLDIPLSEQGRQEVARLADSLREEGLELVYTSPCRAAAETGALLASSLGLKVKCVDKLRNIDQGLWQGLQMDEVRRRHPRVFREWQEHPENVCPPAGEDWSAAVDRVSEALEKLMKKHPAATIGLVVPEPLVSLVRSRLAGCPAVLSKGLSECGSWERLAINGQGVAAN